MNITSILDHQWDDVRSTYLEAFPKAERKPFFTVRRSVKKGKAKIYTASENNTLLGFVMVIPYKNLVMVDYLAVSGNVRSKGTGSLLIQEMCRRFKDRKIILLIEQLDETAANSAQRIARRNFYLKNGFSSSDIFIKGTSGKMEIMNRGKQITPQEYLELQKYALGKLFFRLSKIKIAE